MALEKYACHIAYVCPSTVLLQSTYRFHITAYITRTSKSAVFKLRSKKICRCTMHTATIFILYHQ